MKKIQMLLVFALVTGGLLYSTNDVQARGPSGVGYGIHNLSSIIPPPPTPAMYTSNNQDQICIFCHTPHGGSLDAPLWNRDISNQNGQGSYQHYSSATLSSAGAVTNRTVNNESLVCLSCHDGSVGVGDGLYNDGGIVSSNSGTPVVLPVGQPANGPGARIGASRANLTSNNDLRDDHPISISYATAYGAKTADFNDPSTLNSDLHLFGGASYMVECSTCHDPHVNYSTFGGGNPAYKPFLAMPNNGSAMCLACHIK